MTIWRCSTTAKGYIHIWDMSVPDNLRRHGFSQKQPKESVHFYLTTSRYYDPKTARFLSRDPNATYNSRNPYIYVENNPVNLVDPTGLEPTGVIRGKIENAEGKPIADTVLLIQMDYTNFDYIIDAGL